VTFLHKALAALCGTLLRVGAFTLHYGEGLSYFSTDPTACMNCHIMTPQFNSWQSMQPSHGLPHDFIGKYIAKAENGWNHSKAFTTQDFHEPIQINEKNSQILQDNCLACHSQFVDDLVHSSNTGELGAVRCIHCHRSVGHGEKTGLGGPLRDSERE
jgi:cytochrome c nitrite reductase small subunit